MRASRSYHESKGLQIEPGDTIAIIDGRHELKLIKGQNQRTFDIGIFPKSLLEQRKVPGAAGDVAMRSSGGANGSSPLASAGAEQRPWPTEDRRTGSESAPR